MTNNLNSVYQQILQDIANTPTQPTSVPPTEQPSATVTLGTLGSSGWTFHSNILLGSQKLKPAPKPKSKKGQKIYNLPLLEAFPYQLRGKEQEGEIGLEIECEGESLFDAPIQYWNTHQDGSLRPVNGHPPIEYTLRKPLDRGEVQKALRYLSGKLKLSGSKVVDSTRTSVHVHFNCQRLTIKEVYQFWCLYAVFEEMLIEFSGDDRKGNLFCLSGKQAEYNVHLLEQSIKTEDFNELFNDNLRYTSCNFASLGKFGSLEFRSLRGTTDIGVISLWLDLLYTLKDKALTYKDPQEIVKEFLEVGPEAFLYRVFGHRQDMLDIFREKSDRVQSMWDGLRMMRDVAYAVKWLPYDKSLEKQKKEEESLKVSVSEDILEGYIGPELHVDSYRNDETDLVESHRMYCRRTRALTDVFFSRYSSGRCYLENYTQNVINFNPFRSEENHLWGIPERTKYKVDANDYTYQNRYIMEEEEIAPDEL